MLQSSHLISACTYFCGHEASGQPFLSSGCVVPIFKTLAPEQSIARHSTDIIVCGMMEVPAIDVENMVIITMTIWVQKIDNGGSPASHCVMPILTCFECQRFRRLVKPIFSATSSSSSRRPVQSSIPNFPPPDHLIYISSTRLWISASLYPKEPLSEAQGLERHIVPTPLIYHRNAALIE